MIAHVSQIDRLNSYIEGVISGEIVVGKWVRLAVERHVADLKKEGEEGFPYFFDEREAEQVCIFFPLCFRHSKGKWGGQPFELSDWQLFIVATLFGWRRRSTPEERSQGKPEHVRRFRRSFISVARKNGKTTLAAGITLYMATADLENVAEVYTAATKMEQAKICLFAEAQRMVRQSPHLSRRSKILNNAITFPTLDSYLRPIGSDRPFDGLNPHCVVIDEIHAFKNTRGCRTFLETMKTGSGSRDQPLMMTITTAGDDQSELWIEECTYAKGVVEGLFEDDTVFAYIAEIDETDDPLDEACWPKANPCLGESVSPEYIRELAREAKALPAKMNQFLRYHCNVRVSSQERAFELDAWDECAAELSDWKDADAICAGFDIGTRDDLAAFGLCARFPVDEDDDGNPIYRYEVRAHAFMSANTKRNLQEPPWPEFIGDGLLKVQQYVVSSLRDALIEKCQEHGIRMVAFDPYQAQQMAEDLEAEGLTTVPMPQTHRHFTEPLQEMQSAIADGRFSHDGNRLLRWCASNAVIVKDRNNRWMYDKSSSKEKIDPIVATTMAVKAVMAEQGRPRGPLLLVAN